MESMWSPVGSTSHPTKKKKLCGLHVESTWSPVEFMWSRGVHEESMGQGKVHLGKELTLRFECVI